MPWNYKNLILTSLLAVSFSACSIKQNSSLNIQNTKKEFVKVETKKFDAEDFYIMYALEMESQGAYSEARDVYFKLFDNTNKYEYFVNFLTLSTQMQDFALIEESIEKYNIKNIKEEEIISRLNSFSKLKLGKVDEALQIALPLVKSYPSAINYELLGTIYLTKEDYRNAYNSFSKVYEYEEQENTFQTILNLQFFQLNEKEEAIDRLEDYLRQNDYPFVLSVHLLNFYDQLKSSDRINNFLKELYYEYRSKNESDYLEKLKPLFWQFMKKSELIDFLERNKERDDFLLAAYRDTNQVGRAKALVKDLYEKTGKIDYLAQEAMILFETSKNQEDVLDSVIEKFETVLQSSTNHIYQNYYAYLLIDFDLDIKKGLELVNKALEQDPYNIAYLDTLAWGEYKVKNCQTAFDIMKQIVDEIGLEDDEIKLHWEKIKECK